MKRPSLKEKLFSAFRNELEAAGATKANTKVKYCKKPKMWGTGTLTYLGKLRRRFAALVPRVAGAAFVILVSIAPLVPKSTPVLVPKDNKPVITSPASQTLEVSDFAKFPPSGSLQLYVSQYGIKLPPLDPKPAATYDIQPETHLILVPRSFNAPSNYLPMISGSFLG